MSKKSLFAWVLLSMTVPSFAANPPCPWMLIAPQTSLTEARTTPTPWVGHYQLLDHGEGDLVIAFEKNGVSAVLLYRKQSRVLSIAIPSRGFFGTLHTFPASHAPTTLAVAPGGRYLVATLSNKETFLYEFDARSPSDLTDLVAVGSAGEDADWLIGTPDPHPAQWTPRLVVQSPNLPASHVSFSPNGNLLGLSMMEGLLVHYKPGATPERWPRLAIPAPPPAPGGYRADACRTESTVLPFNRFPIAVVQATRYLNGSLEPTYQIYNTRSGEPIGSRNGGSVSVNAPGVLLGIRSDRHRFNRGGDDRLYVRRFELRHLRPDGQMTWLGDYLGGRAAQGALHPFKPQFAVADPLFRKITVHDLNLQTPLAIPDHRELDFFDRFFEAMARQAAYGNLSTQSPKVPEGTLRQPRAEYSLNWKVNALRYSPCGKWIAVQLQESVFQDHTRRTQSFFETRKSEAHADILIFDSQTLELRLQLKSSDRLFGHHILLDFMADSRWLLTRHGREGVMAVELPWEDLENGTGIRTLEMPNPEMRKSRRE